MANAERTHTKKKTMRFINPQSFKTELETTLNKKNRKTKRENAEN